MSLSLGLIWYSAPIIISLYLIASKKGQWPNSHSQALQFYYSLLYFLFVQKAIF